MWSFLREAMTTPPQKNAGAAFRRCVGHAAGAGAAKRELSHAQDQAEGARGGKGVDAWTSKS